MNQNNKHKNKIRDTHITLAHGSGGQAMRDLINSVFVKTFNNTYLDKLEDQAIFDIPQLAAYGNQLAFTTDSYVVDPLFFPGGDIGTLAINGTINDLAVSGAIPLYISCGVILEEGFPIDILYKITENMQIAAQNAGVKIVTGDTKVVHRGAVDKLFINTTGIGIIRENIHISSHNIQPGDAIIINGEIGNHGTAILAARGELALETEITTDCQPLHDLVQKILNVCPQVHGMRDVTRGGLATVMNEFAQTSHVGISLDETAIPVREEVKGFCEILGLEPLYLANEGKLVVVLPAENVNRVLDVMKSHPAGKNACVIGTVVATHPGIVCLKTIFGTERIIDMLVGEQLPRIC
ncbi:hydrogenase expression/formation protein HypE [Calothrix sp. 336/3]